MEHFVPQRAPKEDNVSHVEAVDVSHSSPKRQRINEGLSKSSSVDASDVEPSLSQPSSERPVHQFSNHELPRRHQHRQAVFYENFAGCAKLSQQMNLVGFESILVDSSHNKHVPLVPVFILDLTDHQAQLCLKQHINATRPCTRYPPSITLWNRESSSRKTIATGSCSPRGQNPTATS